MAVTPFLVIFSFELCAQLGAAESMQCSTGEVQLEGLGRLGDATWPRSKESANAGKPIRDRMEAQSLQFLNIEPRMSAQV